MQPVQLAAASGVEVAQLVREGLLSRPKRLPPVLFYDARGSELFEEITRTPEYYPTRVELSIFEAHGADILAAAAQGRPLQLVELGAGSASKTRTLLRALLARQGRAEYVPIDVSGEALLPAAEALRREMPGLTVCPIVGRNRPGLAAAPTPQGPRLVLFIGSSIGNYEPSEAEAFLADVAGFLRPRDRLLLGTDLHKDPRVLHEAYNDAAGVTAAFNLNVLARLNRELHADFDLDGFRHVAFYDERARRIEMHLESRRAQQVALPGIDLHVRFAQGERIHTENSYKYTEEDVERMARASGLRRERAWTDPKGWFGVHLLARSDA